MRDAEIAELKAQLGELAKQLEELGPPSPGMLAQDELAKRLAALEEASEKVPELPKTVVAAGDFPGSIRIPGTDTASSSADGSAPRRSSPWAPWDRRTGS